MEFGFDVVHKTQKPVNHLALILLHAVADLVQSHASLLLNFGLEIIFRAHVLFTTKKDCYVHHKTPLLELVSPDVTAYNNYFYSQAVKQLRKFQCPVAQ